MKRLWRTFLLGCLLVELGSSASLSSLDDDLFGTNLSDDNYDYQDQQNDESFDVLLERYEKMYSNNDTTDPSIIGKDSNGTHALDDVISSNFTSVTESLPNDDLNESILPTTTMEVPIEIIYESNIAAESDIVPATENSEYLIPEVEAEQRSGTTEPVENEGIEVTTLPTENIEARSTTGSTTIENQPPLFPDLDNSVASSSSISPEIITTAATTENTIIPSSSPPSTENPITSSANLIGLSSELSQPIDIDLSNIIDPNEEALNNIETHDDYASKNAGADEKENTDFGYSAPSIPDSVNQIEDLNIKKKLAEEISVVLNESQPSFELNATASPPRPLESDIVVDYIVQNANRVSEESEVNLNALPELPAPEKPKESDTPSTVIPEVHFKNEEISRDAVVPQERVNSNVEIIPAVLQTQFTIVEYIDRDSVAVEIIRPVEEKYDDVFEDGEEPVSFSDSVAVSTPPPEEEKYQPTTTIASEAVDVLDQSEKREEPVTILPELPVDNAEGIITTDAPAEGTTTEFFQNFYAITNMPDMMMPSGLSEEEMSESRGASVYGITAMPSEAVTTIVPDGDSLEDLDVSTNSNSEDIPEIRTVDPPTTTQPELTTLPAEELPINEVTTQAFVQIITSTPADNSSSEESNESMERAIGGSAIGGEESSELNSSTDSVPNAGIEMNESDVSQSAVEPTARPRKESNESNESGISSNDNSASGGEEKDSSESSDGNAQVAATDAPLSSESKENSGHESNQNKVQSLRNNLELDLFHNPNVLNFSVSSNIPPVENSINAIATDGELENAMLNHAVIKKGGVDKSSFENDISLSFEPSTAAAPTARPDSVAVEEIDANKLVNELDFIDERRKPEISVRVDQVQSAKEDYSTTTKMADDILRTIVAAVEISDDIANTINTFQGFAEQNPAVPESDNQIVPSKNTRELVDLELAGAQEAEAQNREIVAESYVSRITVLFSVFTTIGLFVGLGLFFIPKVRCVARSNFLPM